MNHFVPFFKQSSGINHKDDWTYVTYKRKKQSKNWRETKTDNKNERLRSKQRQEVKSGQCQGEIVKSRRTRGKVQNTAMRNETISKLERKENVLIERTLPIKNHRGKWTRRTALNKLSKGRTKAAEM